MRNKAEDKESDIKRLFFGIEIHAPWPSQLPRGRLLDESHRHLTLAFLGNSAYSPLIEALNHFPKVLLKVGSVGYFDSCLILPPHHPHVMAWHAHWLMGDISIVNFQKILTDWLTSLGYGLDKRDWMPHVTLCRDPFDAEAWIKEFVPLPFYTGSIHLYESMGNLTYIPRWSYPIKAPFEEINHTADMAFIIRGESLQQIYSNAFTALAFKAPELVRFFIPQESFNHLDDIIMTLNDIISRADSIVGNPFKAISFHGEIIPLKDSLLQWEMIVDV
jgi:2'-5' RNA ligase